MVKMGNIIRTILICVCMTSLILCAGCQKHTRNVSSEEIEYADRYDSANEMCVTHGQKYVEHYYGLVTDSAGISQHRWQVICYSENPISFHTVLI